VIGPVEKIPIADRASWLALRRADLTASDVAAVAGFDKRRSPLAVFAEKTGLASPDGDSDIMRRGRWLEPAVLTALREQRPTWDIRRAGVYLRAPEIRLGATPDAVAIDPERGDGIVNVQCKVVSRPVFEADWADSVPIAYQIQTLTEGLLIGAEHSVIVALVIGTYSADLEIRDVPRHAEAEARIEETARMFWQGVADGVPPRADYERDGDVIADIFRQPVPGAEIDLSADNRIGEVLAEIEQLKAVTKPAKDRIEALENEVKDKLGVAEIGKVPGWTVTWKRQTRKAYVAKESSFRKLHIVDKRDEEIGIADAAGEPTKRERSALPDVNDSF